MVELRRSTAARYLRACPLAHDHLRSVSAPNIVHPFFIPMWHLQPKHVYDNLAYRLRLGIPDNAKRADLSLSKILPNSVLHNPLQIQANQKISLRA